MVYALVYGGIQRFYFYDDGTIKSVFSNVSYTLDCNTWGMNNADGQIKITETQYTQLTKYLYYNSGLIKVINVPTYGDGILIRKDLSARADDKKIQLLFLICNYTLTMSGFIDGTPKKAWF